jgi:acetyl esterase
MLTDARMVGGHQPISSVVSLEVAGRRARLYVPSTPTDALLVFIHGGAWIFGDLDSHDAPCRFLAEKAGVRVLAIDYRLAPEHPFPAAYDDCVAAYRWVVEHADELGADPTRLAVGGDSAGGNLATLVAIEAARGGLPCAFQLLVYPGTDMTGMCESRDTFAAGFFLTREFMDLARDCYVPDDADWKDPRVSPLVADLPAGLAPAYVATAGFDPLRDEGEEYARKLADAGVRVELKRYPDQIHGFLNVIGVGRTSRAAVGEIAAKLKAGLASPVS